MERENDSKFVKGLVCGVILTLACMAVWTGVYRIRLNQRLAQLQPDSQTAVTTPTEESREAVENAGTENALRIDQEKVSSKITEIENIINNSFFGDIDTAQVEDYIFVGLMAGLDDPYSEYFPREEKQLFDEETKGVYAGIGATLEQDVQTGVITVASCFPNTAAEEAGLLPGDIIVGINGEDTSGMDLDELVTRIRLKEEESVVLQIRRDEEEFETTLERKPVEIVTVNTKMLEDHIAYLQITEFDDITVEQVEKALKELEKQGMEKLVVDLRDNPGGVLQSVCRVLDLFLPEGLIVYMEDKNGAREEYYSDAEHVFEKPMAVLVNENSASASEIFAGAVKDYGIGTLVGTRTFGKGIVQTMYNLSDGTAVKLTNAKYYTPKGNDIHEIGIEPDIEVFPDEDFQSVSDIGTEKDNQLKEAVSALKKELNY